MEFYLISVSFKNEELCICVKNRKAFDFLDESKHVSRDCIVRKHPDCISKHIRIVDDKVCILVVDKSQSVDSIRTFIVCCCHSVSYVERILSRNMQPVIE